MNSVETTEQDSDDPNTDKMYSKQLEIPKSWEIIQSLF